jgi:polysaccharide biosynthesis transport protein
MNDQSTFIRPERTDKAAETSRLRSIDYREIIRFLRRQVWTISGITVFVMVLAAILVFQITPRFTAEAQILLDTRKMQVVDFQSVLSGLTPDAAVIRSELQVLRSRSLVDKVVQKLNLTDMPGFKLKETDHRSLLSTLSPANWLPQSWLATLGLGGQTLNPSPSPLETQRLQHAVDVLLLNLSILNDGRSYVITIRYEDPDPERAAAIVNTLTDLYLVEQLEAKFDATRRANDWLSKHIDELRDKVRESDEAVQVYREQHKLDQLKDGTVNQQQLAELNSQLVLAHADRVQAEARLRQVQGTIRSPAAADSSIEVLNSPLIQKLREEEAELRRKQAELSTRYLDDHPEMVNIRAQIRDLDHKISDEMGKIMASVASQAEVARAREAALRDSIDQLQKNNSQSALAEVKLHALERESTANQTLFQNFLSRFKETSSEESFQKADARIISPAEIPNSPSYPRKGLALGLTAIFAIGLGILIAVLIERIDVGIRSPEQIEAIMGIRGLGIVPALTRAGSDQTSLADEVVKNPKSQFSEAIRTIRTGILLSDEKTPPKVVLVTSSLPFEGKSSFAVSLAKSAALSQQRVLLIDCDLRRASVAKLMHVEGGNELMQALSGSNALKDAVQVDKDSGLHFLRSKSSVINPPDLFASELFRTFLMNAREQYDLIVLDSPPALAVSDSLILSRLADATVFLVRWAKTPRQVVLSSLRLFDNAQGVGITGVVLSRVNVRRHSLYAYGDYGYYYGRYPSYYR